MTPLQHAAGDRPAVAIIGAGIVGVASALALAADGCRVTVFDRDEPGAGTSSGHAGGIVTGAVTPTATPGVLRAIPSYILDPNNAAVLRPAYSLKVLPWLLRFIAAARPARVAEIAAALQPLVADSMRAHMALADICGAAERIRPAGWLKVYATDAGFSDSALERELMIRHGVNHRVLDAAEVATLEPALNRAAYVRGVFQPESGFVNFPMGQAQAYFRAALERGGRFIQERVRAVRPLDASRIEVRTDSARREFDAIVVAAGAWSKQFASQIGDAVSLDTERGYHISFKVESEPLLARPVCAPDRQFVLSPMHDGVTLVSGDELAGLEAAPDYRRVRALVPSACELLPGLRGAPIQREWMGYRPSTPDSLPVIGRSPRCRNVYYAFGHGHLGLTLSAVTAQLIAGLIGGRAAPFDLAPYRIERF